MASSKFVKSNRFAGLDEYYDDETTKKSTKKVAFPMLRPTFGKKKRTKVVTSKPKTGWVDAVGNNMVVKPLQSSSVPNKKTTSPREKNYKDFEVFSETAKKEHEMFIRRMDERLDEADDELRNYLEYDDYNRWIKNKEEIDDLNEYYDNIDEYEDEDEDSF